MINVESIIIHIFEPAVPRPQNVPKGQKGFASIHLQLQLLQQSQSQLLHL